jgi:hypothetical protein
MHSAGDIESLCMQLPRHGDSMIHLQQLGSRLGMHGGSTVTRNPYAICSDISSSAERVSSSERGDIPPPAPGVRTHPQLLDQNRST